MPKQWVKISEEKGNCYPHPLTIGMRASAGAGKIIYELIGRPEQGFYLDSLTTFGQGNTAYYFYEEEFEKAANDLFVALKADPKIASIIKLKHYYYSKRLLVHGEKIKSLKLNKLDNKELLRLFKTQTNGIFKLWQWGLTISILEYKTTYLSNEIERSFQNIVPNPQQTIQLLISPTQETFSRQEKLSLLLLAEKFSSSPKLKQIILNGNLKNLNKKAMADLVLHHRSYNWLAYYYAGPETPLFETFNALKGYVTNDIAQDLHLHKSELTILKKKQRKIEKNLDPTLRYLLEVARDFTYLKGLRKDALYHSFHAIDFILSEVSRRTGLPMLDMRQLTAEEIAQLLANGTLPEAEVIAKRHQNCAFLMQNGIANLLVEEEATFEIAKIKQDKIQQTGVLKGQIANTGQARGKVKIINNASDLKKMEQGDILVSIATNPTLVPAMKKAAAIITNIGGITCHAAIVSRELGKPCIIGTKNATRLLKDGDMVEVNADHGIVTILGNK